MSGHEIAWPYGQYWP